MAVLRKKIIVRLHDTDAAGLLFFAHQFFFAHDIYEDMLKAIGMPMEQLLAQGEFFVPIVHAESQYLRGLAVGEELEATVAVAHLGITSYTLEYEFRNQAGEAVGRAKTVHVSIDRDTRSKISLPELLRSRLFEFQQKP
jgi:1,4-dihydroxy-2-naphthoyl-CoA hydrolase